jgi:signal transduction histidine kinase
VARSIRGRLADLGGTATVTSTPGEGTVVELVLPS